MGAPQICPPGGWTLGNDRCYKKFGQSKFFDAQNKCGNENASLVSVLDDVENTFLKRISNIAKSKWLGIEPSANQLDRSMGSILWIDRSIGNYSNFVHRRKCGSSVCVNQLGNGSWSCVDCDFSFDVWCFITIAESHRRLIENFGQLLKNATDSITKYPVEQLKSDNIERLAGLVHDLKEAIRVAVSPISHSNTISTISLILSLLALFFAVFLMLKLRRKSTDRNFNGIKRTSFRYSERKNQSLDYPAVIKDKYNYGSSAKNVQQGPYDERINYIDSQNYGTEDCPEPLITSKPQEL